jgi:hypothetical protein
MYEISELTKKLIFLEMLVIERNFKTSFRLLKTISVGSKNTQLTSNEYPEYDSPEGVRRIGGGRDDGILQRADCTTRTTSA